MDEQPQVGANLSHRRCHAGVLLHRDLLRVVLRLAGDVVSPTPGPGCRPRLIRARRSFNPEQQRRPAQFVRRALAGGGVLCGETEAREGWEGAPSPCLPRQAARLRLAAQNLTFGWRRAEVLGGFVNGVFLASMAVFVGLQAMPQFFATYDASQAAAEGSYAYIGVAGAGILLNLLGVTLYSDTHSHSHGGGGHGHSHDDGQCDDGEGGGHAHHGHGHHDGGVSGGGASPVWVETPESSGHAHDHNSWGLFIHFVGDVVTSMLVLGVGLAYHFLPGVKWLKYLDPAAAELSVVVILISVQSLIRSCSWILLQSAPRHIDVSSVEAQILNIGGVTGVHELHIWELVDLLPIASLHVVVDPAVGVASAEIVDRIRRLLHRHGVHASTIQLEDGVHDSCVRRGTVCISDCAADSCCPAEPQASVN